MLIIYSKIDDIFDADTVNIGEQNDLDELLNLIGLSDVSVYADGEEFKLIRSSFENIPFSKISNSSRWFGDMALFIINNIELGYDK